MSKMLRIPAIRPKMGIWMYYVGSLNFGEVADYVRPINDELHKSELLCQMIQRSITENYKDIANYLILQEERFFNALILAVYNGQPEWNEVRIDDIGNGDDHGLGILTLTGEEKIFPVDGQHRVAGIKKVLEINPMLRTERVPVIFIGHSKDEIGMQRTRRMFSTLNRYAKPVSMRDIIALDEDDVVAIASRNLIDGTDMFINERILDAKTKAIPEENDRALTSIITYYECNKELLWLFIKDKEIKGLDDKVIKGHKKINEYIRHRPDDEMIALFTNECKTFWNAIIESCSEGINENNDGVGKYRDKNGGHIFFRPVSLIPFTKMVVRIKEIEDVDYASIIERLPEKIKWIQCKLWRRVIWDDVKKGMIMGNSKLIELLLLYVYDKSILTSAEMKRISKDLESIWNYHERDIHEVLDDIIQELTERSCT